MYLNGAKSSPSIPLLLNTKILSWHRCKENGMKLNGRIVLCSIGFISWGRTCILTGCTRSGKQSGKIVFEGNCQGIVRQF